MYSESLLDPKIISFDVFTIDDLLDLPFSKCHHHLHSLLCKIFRIVERFHEREWELSNARGGMETTWGGGKLLLTVGDNHL